MFLLEEDSKEPDVWDCLRKSSGQTQAVWLQSLWSEPLHSDTSRQQWRQLRKAVRSPDTVHSSGKGEDSKTPKRRKNTKPQKQHGFEADTNVWKGQIMYPPIRQLETPRGKKKKKTSLKSSWFSKLQHGTNFSKWWNARLFNCDAGNTSFRVTQGQHNTKSNPGTLHGLVIVPEDSDNTTTSSRSTFRSNPEKPSKKWLWVKGRMKLSSW